MTGETVASMMAAVAHMTPVLLDRSADDFAGASAAMDAAMYGNSGAKAAIEIALHDLVGRATGRPLHALFGAQIARPVMPVLAVVGSDDAAADLRDAQARYAAGYRAFKIKVGLASPEADAERTRIVCTALKAQSNECRSVSSHPTPIRAMAPRPRCVMCERSPIAGSIFSSSRSRRMISTAWRGSGGCRRRARIWIGADEGIHSLADIARHHERNAARGASLKAIKLGGLRALFEAGRLCERLGMRINISCKTGEFERRVGGGGACRRGGAGLAWGLTVTNPGLAEDVVIAPLRVENGHVAVPDGPGLGIDVDERRVRRRQQDFKRVA